LNAWKLPYVALPSRSQEVESMAKYKTSTLDRVTTELAKPRMAKSARIAELSLDTAAFQNNQALSFPEQFYAVETILQFATNIKINTQESI
jgi:hypothetical protein